MCKIANLYVVSNLQVAVKRYFSHDTLDEGGFSLTVLSYESHLFATLDGKVDVGEDGMFAIHFLYLFANDRIVTATLGRRKLQAEGRVIDLVHLDGDNLFQLLDAALHLYGFGGLVAEAFDEVLRFLNLLLLVLIGTELLLAPLGTELHELVVLHAVVVDASARNLNGAGGDIVNEGTVVAHQHHGITPCSQEVLQPLDTLNVEVVGRLIKQKYIGAAQEQLGQLDTHTPSA